MSSRWSDLNENLFNVLNPLLSFSLFSFPRNPPPTALLTHQQENTSEFLTGWIYPNFLFVISVCFTYSVIAPFIMVRDRSILEYSSLFVSNTCLSLLLPEVFFSGYNKSDLLDFYSLFNIYSYFSFSFSFSRFAAFCTSPWPTASTSTSCSSSTSPNMNLGAPSSQPSTTTP